MTGLGGHTRTTILAGAPTAIQVGQTVPIMRSDGILLNAEVMSVEHTSDGPVVVLWHDLPLDVDVVKRTYAHADGRTCTWDPESVGRPVWAYSVSDTEGAPCYRDHWMVLL